MPSLKKHYRSTWYLQFSPLQVLFARLFEPQRFIMKTQEERNGLTLHYVDLHSSLTQKYPPVLLFVPPLGTRVDSPEVVNSLLHCYRGGFRAVAFDWPQKRGLEAGPIEAAVQALQAQFPNSDLYAIGAGLSGSLLLKLNQRGLFKAVAVIDPVLSLQDFLPGLSKAGPTDCLRKWALERDIRLIYGPGQSLQALVGQAAPFFGEATGGPGLLLVQNKGSVLAVKKEVARVVESDGRVVHVGVGGGG